MASADATPAYRSTQALGQFGNELLIFLFSPGSGGPCPHIALIADRQCELGDVVVILCFGEDNKIGCSGRQIHLFDFDAYFLREFTCDFCALGNNSLMLRIP